MKSAGRRLTILDLVLLIAGLAVGVWLAMGVSEGRPPETVEQWVTCVLYVLGGVSTIGPPLLLRERLRHHRRLRPGELLWFCQGTAAWLLWPPVIVRHVRAKPGEISGAAAICYVYGTPLMAVYVTVALFAGGWLPLRRRRYPRNWTESFGLILGLIWACTGLYSLWLIYHDDLFRR
jgi:hypothetical protein